MASKPIPEAKPLDPPFEDIVEVFLGATARDLADARKKTCAALEKYADVRVRLQEDWVSPAVDAVTVCLSKLEKSSGYVGLFGFRYGWIPDGYDHAPEGRQCSITELECNWARQRWASADPPVANPPVFLFVPQLGSDAWEWCLKQADLTLAQDFPDAPEKREEDKRRQVEFVQRLRKSTILNHFSDIEELRLEAVYAVSHWNGELLKANAARREITANYSIPDEELGEIGRKRQFDALDDALMALNASDAPALCALVHGPASAGLRPFCQSLASWHGWPDLGVPIKPGCPATQPYNLASLLRWAFTMIRAKTSAAEATIESLASEIAMRLERSPVILLLQNLDTLEGGRAAFHVGFWSPLYSALAHHRKRRRMPFRFVMAVMTTKSPHGDSAVWNGNPSDQADRELLCALPVLGKLTKDDVERWLGPNLNYERAS